jgi:hypothetical protein
LAQRKILSHKNVTFEAPAQTGARPKTRADEGSQNDSDTDQQEEVHRMKELPQGLQSNMVTSIFISAPPER